MHNLLKEHTLTALSPKMSNFFISSATTMSWQERNGEAGVSREQLCSGRGGEERSIPYSDSLSLAVHLQRALPLREGAVVEGDGRGTPLPLLQGQESPGYSLCVTPQQQGWPGWEGPFELIPSCRNASPHPSRCFCRRGRVWVYLRTCKEVKLDLSMLSSL